MLTKDQALQRCMSACMQHAAEWQQGDYEAYRESVVQNLDAVVQLHVLTNSLVQRLHYVWRTPKELWRVQHRTQQIYCRSLDENLAHSRAMSPAGDILSDCAVVCTTSVLWLQISCHTRI